MKEKIKPCPFCGSKAEVYESDRGSWVECSNGDCNIGHKSENWLTGYAIKSWNTRTEIKE